MPSLSDHLSREYTKLTVGDISHHFNMPMMVNEHGCWLWLGTTDKYGYARYSGSLVYGIVWRLAGKECLSPNELCHKCPSKNCINPDHLYVGSHKQNMQDASIAGVMSGPRKVSLMDIEIVKTMLKEGKTQKEIAKTINVSPAWMTKFLNGSFKYAKLK